MTWSHILDLLEAQRRLFPLGDIRPLAPVPKGLEALEAHLRAAEAAEHPVVEAALREYIAQGDWPEGLTAVQAMFVNLRLGWAWNTVLRLAVPLPPAWARLPLPAVTDEELFTWLLITQWEALGRDAWVWELLALRGREAPGGFGGRSPPAPRPPWRPGPSRN